MVFYGKEVENKVRWGISWCVSKVDKHVDEMCIRDRDRAHRKESG